MNTNPSSLSNPVQGRRHYPQKPHLTLGNFTPITGTARSTKQAPLGTQPGEEIYARKTSVIPDIRPHSSHKKIQTELQIGTHVPKKGPLRDTWTGTATPSPHYHPKKPGEFSPQNPKARSVSNTPITENMSHVFSTFRQFFPSGIAPKNPRWDASTRLDKTHRSPLSPQ